MLARRNPTPERHVTTPAEETRDAILNAIKAQVAAAPNATTLLRLAEAYAWTVAPDQGHGGGER
jgi:hypothetical protein